MEEPISRLVSASKTFELGPERIRALGEVSLSISRGETVAIVGPSGAGKTTLLRLIGGLEQASSGKVFFFDKELGSISRSERRRIRLANMGYVFQQLKLLPTLSAIENVELPMALSERSTGEQKSKAMELLDAVGLRGKERRKPDKLSLGEQQRVAIARALANNPKLILADEPTSQLDSSTGAKVIDLLLDLSESNTALVIATHDRDMASSLKTMYQIRDGSLA
jgi:ABC-type lipoprotein export system ATPase subunit